VPKIISIARGLTELLIKLKGCSFMPHRVQVFCSAIGENCQYSLIVAELLSWLLPSDELTAH